MTQLEKTVAQALLSTVVMSMNNFVDVIRGCAPTKVLLRIVGVQSAIGALHDELKAVKVTQ